MSAWASRAKRGANYNNNSNGASTRFVAQGLEKHRISLILRLLLRL
jgi:hypothetical protein